MLDDSMHLNKVIEEYKGTGKVWAIFLMSELLSYESDPAEMCPNHADSNKSQMWVSECLLQIQVQGLLYQLVAKQCSIFKAYSTIVCHFTLMQWGSISAWSHMCFINWTHLKTRQFNHHRLDTYSPFYPHPFTNIIFHIFYFNESKNHINHIHIVLCFTWEDMLLEQLPHYNRKWDLMHTAKQYAWSLVGRHRESLQFHTMES